MNISDAQYYKDIDNKNVVGIKAILNNNPSFIPIQTENSDYQAIQEWVSKGNKIAEAD